MLEGTKDTVDYWVEGRTRGANVPIFADIRDPPSKPRREAHRPACAIGCSVPLILRELGHHEALSEPPFIRNTVPLEYRLDSIGVRAMNGEDK